MKNRNLVHSDNWETPKELYDELDAEFDFDFDPCPINTSEITPDKDGLLIDWGKRNFINPSYSTGLVLSLASSSDLASPFASSYSSPSGPSIPQAFIRSKLPLHH